MKDTDALKTLIQAIIEDCKFRAPSLIVTLLGDFMAPHGGTFWMGSLIDLMAPLGINERLVRTATFRLTKEDWLSSKQIGRKSYYTLTKSSVKSFEEAFRRVYTTPEAPWNGDWCLVFMNSADITPELRDKLRAELFWLGFGMVSPTVFAHPTAEMSVVRDHLKSLGLLEKTTLMRARLDELNEEEATSQFIRKCWDIEKLAADYTTFLDRFRPLWRMLRQQPPAPDLCFIIRLIVIHEYRRLTLRDPQLPTELLAPDWAGSAARILCRNLYRRVQAGAEEYLLSHTETADGPLPAAAPPYFRRFGGLN